MSPENSSNNKARKSAVHTNFFPRPFFQLPKKSFCDKNYFVLRLLHKSFWRSSFHLCEQISSPTSSWISWWRPTFPNKRKVAEDYSACKCTSTETHAQDWRASQSGIKVFFLVKIDWLSRTKSSKEMRSRRTIKYSYSNESNTLVAHINTSRLVRVVQIHHQCGGSFSFVA